MKIKFVISHLPGIQILPLLAVSWWAARSHDVFDQLVEAALVWPHHSEINKKYFNTERNNNNKREQKRDKERREKKIKSHKLHALS